MDNVFKGLEDNNKLELIKSFLENYNCINEYQNEFLKLIFKSLKNHKLILSLSIENNKEIESLTFLKQEKKDKKDLVKLVLRNRIKFINVGEMYNETLYEIIDSISYLSDSEIDCLIYILNRLYNNEIEFNSVVKNYTGFDVVINNFEKRK